MASEATAFKAGGRVLTTKLVRMHTHNGVFERPPGTEGTVERVGDSPLGFPEWVHVRIGEGIGSVVVVFPPDELRPAGQEDNDA